MIKNYFSGKRHLDLFLLVAVSIATAFIFFFALGENYLTNWDEAWYADVSRKMFETGRYFTPVWNGRNFFDKPPLYFWITTVFFKVFGVNEFAARAPSALAGVGTVMLVYACGALLFGIYEGIIASAALTSTIGFIYRARTGNLDALFAFFLMYSLYCLLKADIKETQYPKNFILAGLFTAAAVLTKGMLGYFPLCVYIGYSIIYKKKEIFKNKHVIAGALLSLSLPILWLFTSYKMHGEEFLAQFFQHQTGKFSTYGGFWQHFSLVPLLYLKSGLKLWLLLFLPCVFYYLARFRKDIRFIFPVYFLFFLILIAFAENKSNWFLMPIYPIASLIIAGAVGRSIKNTQIPIRVCVCAVIIFIAVFEDLYYKDQYIVPDIVKDEVFIARAAQELTSPHEYLYLTNYLVPTTAYYSRRRIFAVYGDQEKDAAWWILPEKSWDNILREKSVYIVTTKTERAVFDSYKTEYRFDTLYESGDKVLIKKGI